MEYLKFSIVGSTDLNEIIIAFLGALDFEAFQENEEGLDAWIQEELCTEENKQAVENLSKQYSFSYTSHKIPHQNWNAKWESDYPAICIEDFCAVRASFHDAFENVKYEIVIDPKMAFGTGHHATTSMVIETMRSIDFNAKKVLDYGCGTGILAILASMMGANPIDAIDYDVNSTENTTYNTETNSIKNVNVVLGKLASIRSNEYDVILANINRNVILDSFSRIAEIIKTGGVLITSGYLLEDENIIKSAAEKLNFSLHMRTFKQNWLCLTFIKNEYNV